MKDISNHNEKINYLVEKYGSKDKYNFINENINNRKDIYIDKKAYQKLNKNQVTQLLKTIERRYNYFDKKLNDDKKNPYANYGFIDKDTKKSLSYEELQEKYRYRTNYKVNLLYHISEKDFLYSRNSLFKLNLIKMYDSMGNEDKVIELLSEGLSKTMRKYYIGEYEIVETYKDYNAVKEAGKLNKQNNSNENNTYYNIDEGKK